MIKILLIILIVMIFAVISLVPRKPKRGLADENMTLIIPIAKTIYKVTGHFSKTSKMTAKDKISRIIKKEISK